MVNKCFLFSKPNNNLPRLVGTVRFRLQMAHFSARLKLLSSSDGLSRDQFRQQGLYMSGGSPLIRVRRSRLKLDVFRARVFSSYSFSLRKKKIRDFDSDQDGDDWDFDGDEDGLEADDDLSCFRGLVLDISYRSSLLFLSQLLVTYFSSTV